MPSHSHSHSLHLLLITLQTTLLLSTALPHLRPPSFTPESLNSATTTTTIPPTTYFEVTKPINHPKTKPCSSLLLTHDFAYTYGAPPVFANYTPPSNCPSKKFSSIVLSWSATCHGRQFDRIFGVWLGGVELLRSCTAEPRPNGIVWKVDKDITRYYSLLMSNQTLAVYLGNLVTTVYTGIYHVDISIHFYPSEEGLIGNNWADLILPISRNLPLNDGLWFEIQNSTDVEIKEFEIPLNCYRAVLEVYVSYHQNDEFWYTNLPDDFIAANNLTGANGNGPFREIVVTLDEGVVIGAVWPFTVIYTGGINPLLWRPISAIGSFDLPTYDIELTPFLGKLLDGRKHRIGFGVTNALNVWLIDANLHLWLDNKSPRTFGQLLYHHAPSLHSSLKSSFVGLNGTFVTKAKRSISSTGWVRSSHGKIITSFTQDFKFGNLMILENNGDVQMVNQTIDFNTSVSTNPSSTSTQSHKTFPLYLYTAQIDQGDNDYTIMANVSLGFNENKISGSLENSQNATGVILVRNNSVVSGLGSTRQVYKYDSCIEPCYLRNVSSSNYTILYNRVSTKCSKTKLGTDDLSVQ